MDKQEIGNALDFAFDDKQGRFSDLPYYIDEATHTGSRGVGTPFSDIYIKELKEWFLSLVD
jgi:hypothetical protein